MIPDADSIKLIDTIVEEVAYGSALNDSQFACSFLTLTKQRSYENMCLIKPLFKLVVEGKQNKQLIDRSKPDDVHLPFQQFLFQNYHVDLYCGILAKTLVEQRSIFLSLLH